MSIYTVNKARSSAVKRLLEKSGARILTIITNHNVNTPLALLVLATALFTVSSCAAQADREGHLPAVAAVTTAAAPRPAEALERGVSRQYGIIDNDLAGGVRLDQVRLVFVGDSITRGWMRQGQSFWNENFAQAGTANYALNLGVSGDRAEHVLYRLTPRAEGGLGHLDDPAIRPQTIFLMIGTNSFWEEADWGATGSETRRVAQGVIAVANRLHDLRPGARIVIQSILPVRDAEMNRLRVVPINELVKRSVAAYRADDDFEFLDLYPRFVDTEGHQNTALFRDDVHLNADGYAIWNAMLLGDPDPAPGAPAPVAEPELDPLFTYPNGMRKALLISMDDGNETDRQMIAILNRYNLAGTFHLNSGLLGTPVTWFNDKYGADIRYVTTDEVAALYRGHEVASHSLDHPRFRELGRDAVEIQVLADKEALEQITGAPVRGIAYPFGAPGEHGAELARRAGHHYGRLARPNHLTSPPHKLFRWMPTAHPDTALEEFRAYDSTVGGDLSVFTLMGHSYEYIVPGSPLDWDAFEEFCRTAASAQGVWSTTMIDYIDYVEALRKVQATLHDGAGVNVSDIEIWVDGPGGAAPVSPGDAFAVTD